MTLYTNMSVLVVGWLTTSNTSLKILYSTCISWTPLPMYFGSLMAHLWLPHAPARQSHVRTEKLDRPALILKDGQCEEDFYFFKHKWKTYKTKALSQATSLCLYGRQGGHHGFPEDWAGGVWQPHRTGSPRYGQENGCEAEKLHC